MNISSLVFLDRAFYLAFLNYNLYEYFIVMPGELRMRKKIFLNLHLIFKAEKF